MKFFGGEIKLQVQVSYNSKTTNQTAMAWAMDKLVSSAMLSAPDILASQGGGSISPFTVVEARETNEASKTGKNQETAHAAPDAIGDCGCDCICVRCGKRFTPVVANVNNWAYKTIALVVNYHHETSKSSSLENLCTKCTSDFSTFMYRFGKYKGTNHDQ